MDTKKLRSIVQELQNIEEAITKLIHWENGNYDITVRLGDLNLSVNDANKRIILKLLKEQKQSEYKNMQMALKNEALKGDM